MNTPLQDTAAPKRQRWASSVAWIGVIVGIASLLAMLLSGPLYRMGTLDLRPAFSLMGWGAKLGLLALVIGLLGLILALMARHGRSGGLAVLAIVLGLAAFMPPWMFRNKAASVPAIHDISTDTSQPPAFKALLAQRADAPNPATYGGPEIAAQQHKAYPDIRPLDLRATPHQVFEAALATARDMGWVIAAQDPNAKRIEATATTFWYGFKDDVVIRIRRINDQLTRLDIRSVSRVGKSDVGKNAERIRTFEQRMRKALPGA